MRNQDGEWRIYDLTIDGVSLALTYRSEFSAKIRQQSLDALIGELETRNREGP
jgi:phospholipid transport system substrate-binding protein